MRSFDLDYSCMAFTASFAVKPKSTNAFTSVAREGAPNKLLLVRQLFLLQLANIVVCLAHDTDEFVKD